MIKAVIFDLGGVLLDMSSILFRNAKQLEDGLRSLEVI